MGQVQTVPAEITDFSGEGTRVLFCKSLNVTSDEEDDNRGVKRTYESRRDRETPARYKRHRLSNECGENLRPSSRCSVRSDLSRRAPKRLPERPFSAKMRSKPSANRSQPAASPDRGMEKKASKNKSKTSNELMPRKHYSKVPVDKNKYNRNDEVTLYEKTIITVTSSDNYLIGDAVGQMYRYKSDLLSDKSLKLPNATSNQIKSAGFLPTSYGVVGAYNSDLRKGLTKREVSLNRSNDVQILPVIQELNMQDDVINHTQTKSAVSSDSDCRDLMRCPKKSISMRACKVKAGSKTMEEPASSLFPNSCLKKGKKTTSNKKSVRFMVSDSQNQLEDINKKSLRLEKFPSKLSVNSHRGNEKMRKLTAAPVVVRIKNTTMERMGSLRGDEFNDIFCRETSQTMVQERVISNVDFVGNMNDNRERSMHLIEGLGKIQIPGEPFEFSMGSSNNDTMGPKFHAILLKHIGVTNDMSEIQYTMSDIKLEKYGNEEQFVMENGGCEVPDLVRGVQQSKIDDRRKNIRLMLNESYPNYDGTSGKRGETEIVVTRNGRNNVVRSDVVNSRSVRICSVNQSNNKSSNVQRETTRQSGFYKPTTREKNRTNVTAKTPIDYRKNDDLKPTINSKLVKMRRPATEGSKTVASRDISPMSLRSIVNSISRPKTQEVRSSSPGDSQSNGIGEFERRSMVHPQTSPNDSGSRGGSRSPQRQLSRKPHLILMRRVNDDTSKPSGTSHGGPRTPLTLRPKTQPDLKTTKSIRQHLRSSGIQSVPPNNMNLQSMQAEIKPNPGYRPSKKLAGHPLRNKTLSEFLEARKRREEQSRNNDDGQNKGISKLVK